MQINKTNSTIFNINFGSKHLQNINKKFVMSNQINRDIFQSAIIKYDSILKQISKKGLKLPKEISSIVIGKLGKIRSSKELTVDDIIKLIKHETKPFEEAEIKNSHSGKLPRCGFSYGFISQKSALAARFPFSPHKTVWDSPGSHSPPRRSRCRYSRLHTSHGSRDLPNRLPCHAAHAVFPVLHYQRSKHTHNRYLFHIPFFPSFFLYLNIYLKSSQINLINL